MTAATTPTLQMGEDGTIPFPDEYVDVTRFVVRTPYKTEVHQGSSMTYYNTENDHVAPGEIEFKAFGESPETYVIENFDEVVDEDSTQSTL